MHVIRKIVQHIKNFIPEGSRIQRILILLKIVNNPIVNEYRMRKLRRELSSLKRFVIGGRKFDDLVDLNSERYEIFYFKYVHMHKLGLTAMIKRTFEGIFDIMQRGNIPIIDWQSEPNSLLEPEKVGKENAWDYYFSQPFGVSLRDVERNSCTVSTLPDSDPCRIFDLYPLFLNKRIYCGHFDFMLAFFDRFVKFTPYVQSFMEKTCNALINPDMRVLGVSYRYDFYYSKIPGHPVQPSINDIISKTHFSLKKWNCTHIYILADSPYVIDRFREEFPEKIITYERDLTDNRKPLDEINNTYGSYLNYHLKHMTDKELEEVHNARTPPGVRFQRQLDYLTDIYIFSRCTSAIFGVSGASAFAYLLNNNKYENEYIYSLGYY